MGYAWAELVDHYNEEIDADSLRELRYVVAFKLGKFIEYFLHEKHIEYSPDDPWSVALIDEHFAEMFAFLRRPLFQTDMQFEHGSVRQQHRKALDKMKWKRERGIV